LTLRSTEDWEAPEAASTTPGLNEGGTIIRVSRWLQAPFPLSVGSGRSFFMQPGRCVPFATTNEDSAMSGPPRGGVRFRG